MPGTGNGKSARRAKAVVRVVREDEADLDERRNEIFERFLDAKLRAAYLRRIAHGRHVFEAALAISSAVAASSAFVAWAATQSTVTAQALSLAVAVVSALAAFFLAKSPVADWRELSAEWTRREAAWGAMWFDARRGSAPAIEEIRAAMAQDVGPAAKDAQYPHRRGLIRRIQNQIKQAEGIHVGG